jgi:hypothetical protein
MQDCIPSLHVAEIILALFHPGMESASTMLRRWPVIRYYSSMRLKQRTIRRHHPRL